MNKSIEYIKNRIKRGNVKDMTEEEFSNMVHISFVEAFNKMVNVAGIEKIENSIMLYSNVELKYDPNADFDYFTLKSCYCDGTLMFFSNLVKDTIESILNLNTCYSPAIDKYLEQHEEIEYEKIKIKYTVGDFVVNSYITESPDPSKPWMRDKFTVMLPIKYEIKEKK